MTLNPKLQEAANRLAISDVVLKRIDASLSDGVDQNASFDSKDLLLQTIFPTCRGINQYEGFGGEQNKCRVVFEMFAGLRVLHAKGVEPKDLVVDDIERLVCATVECYFLVKYDFVAGELSGSLDEECLSEFGQHNVPFNVWPYWREIVQSACGRMGLPRIVLPTHRLHKSATLKGGRKDDVPIAQTPKPANGERG